ncbi:unnamed protein product, partial [Scytosiphon promiscuus]
KKYNLGLKCFCFLKNILATINCVSMKIFLNHLLALFIVVNLGSTLYAQNENPSFSHTIKEEL